MPTRKAASLPPAPGPTPMPVDPRHTAIFVVVVTGLNQAPGGSPPIVRPVRLDDDLLAKVLAVAQQQLTLRPPQDLTAFVPPFTGVAAPGVSPPLVRPRSARNVTSIPRESSPKKGKLTR